MCCLTSHWFPGSSSECTRKAWETRGRLMAGSHGEDVHRGSVRTWRPATITATTVGHRGHNSCLPSPTRVQLWERGHECREGNSTAKAQLGVSLPALGGGDSLSGTWGNSWVGNAAHSRPPAWEETVSKTHYPSSQRQAHRHHCFRHCLPAPCRPRPCAPREHVRALALQRSHYLMVTLL